MFCIKPYVFVISDNIKPVRLPGQFDGPFDGYMGDITGWGRTFQCKCIATFNLHSKIKDGYYTVGATWI
jgi:hypothetical protein